MGKTGSAASGLYSLVSFFVQLAVSILQYVALFVSAGVTVYTVGDYTRQIIRDKKQVLEIVYWRDPKRSAAALAAALFALYLVSRCSVISLVAYASLAVLAGTVGFRLFKLAEAQVKKSDGSNPFKQYLEQDVEVPKEKLHTQVDIFIEHAQSLFKHLRHLFLVESIVDSVKFGLLLYTLTYVGAWFSGITLVLIFVLAVFSVPKVYELYKEPIDHYIAIAREHVEKVQHTVQDKAPFLRKLLEGEKKEQ